MLHANHDGTLVFYPVAMLALGNPGDFTARAPRASMTAASVIVQHCRRNKGISL